MQLFISGGACFVNPSLIFLALERRNLTSLLTRSVNDRVVDVKKKMAVFVYN
jgi:hypothetical protein